MKTIKVGLVYNEPLASGLEYSESSRDVLDQVEAVENALRTLKSPFVRIPFTRRLDELVIALKQAEIDVVFNLCETVDENPEMTGHPAAVFEVLGIPFTGSPSLSLQVTTDKLLTKQLLEANGILTPGYAYYNENATFQPGKLQYPVILKPRHQDASIGIDQDSVVMNSKALRDRLKPFFKEHGPFLIEEFIHGREFNVSVLGYPTPTVLPAGEILFSSFPANLHRIVGYRAKWDKESFEYQHTERHFSDDLPVHVMRTMRYITKQCFRVFMLRDYGRVDIRIDDLNRIFVLEANANPCLSPDAGFAAAAARDGFSYEKLVESFINYASLRAAGEKNHLH